MTSNDDRDDLDTWLHDRIEPLSPPPGTFEAIQRRSRRRRLRRLAVTAGTAAVIVAAAVTVPQVVKMPVEPAQQVAGAAPATATTNTTGGPGNVEAPTAAPVPLPSGNPVPPNFQPTSITAVSARTMFVIGQAGSPGHCATQYCTSVARTQDDGGTWAGLPAPLTGAPDGATGVGQIRFLDGINGWAFGPELWATHDGGKNWTQISTHGRRVIDVETVGARAFAIEAKCTGTGPDYALQCTSFTLYTAPATTDHWTPLGKTTTNLTSSVSSYSPDGWGAAALVLTGTEGYLLAPDGTLYSGLVTGTQPWREAGRIPCPVGLAAQDGTPAWAALGALAAQSLILDCSQTGWIYRSSDGGATWQQAAGVPDTNGPGGAVTITTSITTSPEASVILGTNKGIEVLPAGGGTWRAATLAGTAPDRGFSFVGMTTWTNGIALPADATTGTVWFTTDGGLSWAPSQVQGPDQ